MPSIRSERPQSFSWRSGSTPGRCCFSSSAGTSAVAGASRSRIDRVVRLVLGHAGDSSRPRVEAFQHRIEGGPEAAASRWRRSLRRSATTSSFQGWMSVAGTIPSARAFAMFTGLSSTSTWIPSSTQRGTLSNEQWRSS